MTLNTLRAHRQWQRAVDERKATGEMVVLLAREIRRLEGDHEACAFIKLAWNYISITKPEGEP